MILAFVIICTILILVVGQMILSWNRNGKDRETSLHLLSIMNTMENEMENMKTCIRAIADTTAKTEATVELMKQEMDADGFPDPEKERKAKEAIDRFNEGISNILSYGQDDRGGEKK